MQDVERRQCMIRGKFWRGWDSGTNAPWSDAMWRSNSAQLRSAASLGDIQLCTSPNIEVERPGQ